MLPRLLLHSLSNKKACIAAQIINILFSCHDHPQSVKPLIEEFLDHFKADKEKSHRKHMIDSFRISI